MKNQFVGLHLDFIGFIASNALIHGYRRHHHKLLALTIAVIGFVLIGLGQVLEPEWREALLTSAGGTIIAIAHLVNLKQVKES